MRADVVVLGAGIVGLSVALHLQQRGRAVVLVDRRPPGEGASFGNTGLIQREGVVPYAFPRDLGSLARYARNREIDARFQWRSLPGLAPFLARYWWHSEPRRHQAIARLYRPMIERSVAEHLALAEEAGATALLRPSGWIKVFRTPAAFEAKLAEAEDWRRDFGIGFTRLDRDALAEAEPHLDPNLVGGIHFTDPVSVTNPHALTVAYAELFQRLGGVVAVGDAATLAGSGSGWTVTAAQGPIEAGHAVVALGAWADVVTRRLGYCLPLGVKRGYHMHYRARGNAVLRHTVLDIEGGYALAPMARGLRLTTGAEFAHRDAPPNPAQLGAAERKAESLFSLGERLDPEPWMGVRPCTPDMMPVIGPAPRHEGLWFAFGHAHHGLTLGPATGRLLSEMMTGKAPFTDPRPYRADRF